jgi:superfamily II DNA/RNA helicase
MLDIIEKALEEVVTLARIDGSTAEKHRQSIVDDFNSGTSVVEAMLLSTKAAGVGLTLTGADRVVIYDPSWTPAEDSQAVDRAYRIGQTRKVFVYRMITAGTVEEKMYEKQVHKDGIRRAVFTEDTTVERHFDKDDLRKLFNLAPPGVCEVMEKVQQAAQGLQRTWDEYEFALSHRGVVGLSRHDGFYHNKPVEEDETETAFDGQTSAGKKVLGRSQRALQKDTTRKLPVERIIVEIDDEDDDKENTIIDIVSPPRASSGKHVDEAEVVDPPTPCKDIESEAIEWQEVVEVVNPLTPREDIGNEAIEWQQQDVNPPTPRDNVESEAIDEDEAEESVATLFQRVELLASSGYPKSAFKLLLHMLENRYNDLDRQEKIEVHTQIGLAGNALGLFE